MNIHLNFRLCVIVVLLFLSASVFAEDKAANQTCSFKLLLSDKKCQINATKSAKVRICPKRVIVILTPTPVYLDLNQSVIDNSI